MSERSTAHLSPHVIHRLCWRKEVSHIYYLGLPLPYFQAETSSHHLPASTDSYDLLLRRVKLGEEAASVSAVTASSLAVSLATEISSISTQSHSDTDFPVKGGEHVGCGSHLYLALSTYDLITQYTRYSQV